MRITEKFDIENAYTLANLCKLVYQDNFPEDIEKSKYYRFFNTGGTQALVYGDDNDLFCVFRGTSEIKDWLTDIQIKREPWLEFGEIHKGFKEAFSKTASFIEDYLRGILLPNHILWFAGHSLGGALSLLTAMYIKHIRLTDNMIIYTFGCPRVGNRRWALSYAKLLSENTYRVVNGNDLVSKIPRKILGYKHPPNTLIYIGNNGKIHTKENAISWIKTLGDIIYGKMHNLFKIDCIRDHSIDETIKQLERNL